MLRGDRRVGLLVVACASLELLGSACSPPREPTEAVAAPARRRPNVLVIVTDDHRAHQAFATMPATRRIFKRNGTYFTNAYATTPLCCPSRASIMSGRYAHNHRVRSHRGTAAENLDQDRTIQAFLQRAGYETGLFGKYLNEWDPRDDPPFFDTWAFFSTGSPYTSGTYNIDGNVRRIDRYSTTFIADRALAFLKESDEAQDRKPWFAYVATNAPHGPAQPERRYRDSHIDRWKGNPAVFEEDRSDKPPWIQKSDKGIEEGRRVRAGQLRSLRSVDDLIERMFSMLRRLRERNTIAFFISDNGKLWGEHGAVGKTRPYNDSVRIPILMRWPGRVPAGVEDARIAANIDIAPTIVRSVGLSLGTSFDGRSLFADATRREILLEYWKSPDFPTPPWASLRSRKRQYVEHYDRAGAIQFREYYDLVADPWQLENLLGDDDPLNDPDVAALHRELSEARRCRGQECP